MNKKGDLQWGVIITAIIVVILLFVIIFFFRENITNLGKGFKNLVEGSTAGIEEINIKDLTGESVNPYDGDKS